MICKTELLSERTGGLVLDDAFFRPLGPVGKNLGMMMPLSFGVPGVIVVAVLLSPPYSHFS